MSDTIKIKCHSCGTELPSGSKFCPHCGATIIDFSSGVIERQEPSAIKAKKPTKSQGKRVVAAVGILVVFLLVLLGVYYVDGRIKTVRSSETESKLAETETIETKITETETENSETTETEAEPSETDAIEEETAENEAEEPEEVVEPETAESDNVEAEPEKESEVQEEPVEEEETKEPEEEHEVPAETSEYVIADSDSRYLTDAEISKLSLREINYAKNEIYARHGRIFQRKELREYFESKSWYQGTISGSQFDASVLNEFEAANVVKLSQAEYAIDPNGY